VAEAGLTEVSTLLQDLEGLVDKSANDAAITDDERDANQLEIDAILGSINRIANSNELQGRRLLNGDLAYTTSGVQTSQIAHLQINSVRMPASGHQAMSIQVTQAASQASLSYVSGTITGSGRTIEVGGKLGREIFTFSSGTTVGNMVSAINQAANTTGVSAYASGTNYVYFRSREYGAAQFVRVKLLSGNSFNLAGGKTEDYGEDVVARVNGMTTVGTGLKVSLRTSSLDADITLTTGMATQTTATAAFQITGGGATFSFTPKLDFGSLASLGVDSVQTTSLGDRNTGLLYTLATGEVNALTNKNYQTAQQIVRLAANQVAALRGRLGAFERDTLATSDSSLAIQYENISSAESTLRDADFAQETSNLTRAQILVQSATIVLKAANQAPQAILSLLQ
jgi:flagellin